MMGTDHNPKQATLFDLAGGAVFEFVHFSPISEAGVEETLCLSCFAAFPHN